MNELFDEKSPAYPAAHGDGSFAEEAPAPMAAADAVVGEGSKLGGLVKELLQVVVPALALALLVHLFLAQATVVYGKSMEPNLQAEQRLLSYRFRAPQRDDIVVVDRPDMAELLVKRIVALPGETVEIRAGSVFVDGMLAPEIYPHDLTPYDMAPVKLGPLAYFVMGDNRSNSNDSRSFGPISRDMILGRVWLRYWPLSEFVFF
jgi:signal peptidase I